MLEKRNNPLQYEANSSSPGSIIKDEVETYYGSSDKFIDNIKFSKDAITGDEEISISYIGNDRKIHNATFLGKEFVYLIEKYAKEVRPLEIQTFVNPKTGKKWFWGVGTHAQVEALNIMNNFETVLDAFEAFRDSGKIDRGVYGIRKQSTE